MRAKRAPRAVRPAHACIETQARTRPAHACTPLHAHTPLHAGRAIAPTRMNAKRATTHTRAQSRAPLHADCTPARMRESLKYNEMV